MRIRKVSETAPVQAQIVDGYSTSTTDGYSANYLNGKLENYKVLWTGTCAKGGTVTLNDNIKNYNHVFIRIGTNATYMMCPIIQTSSAVRGNNTFIADSNNYIDFLTIKCACENTSFTVVNWVALRLTVSSGVTDNSSSYTAITEVIVVK